MLRFKMTPFASAYFLAIIAIAVVVCLLFARRDTIRNFRTFLNLHAIRVALRNPLTAILVIGLAALFVSTVILGISELIGGPDLFGFAMTCWLYSLGFIGTCLVMLLPIVITREAFRSVRRKHSRQLGRYETPPPPP